MFYDVYNYTERDSPNIFVLTSEVVLDEKKSEVRATSLLDRLVIHSVELT